MTKSVHICLILEETYPHVIGGVSSWTHLLLSNLPEFEFSIYHIFTGDKPTVFKYEIPSNVREIRHFPLTVKRNTLNLESLLSGIPKATIYHALSTGFAGYIGTEIKKRNGRPFILTEHGIYWHEVELGVDEIECGFKLIKSGVRHVHLGRTWKDWATTFRHFALESYRHADEIITVSNYNRSLQKRLGADPQKCQVIPNGLDLEYYSRLFNERNNSSGLKIGLIGRVTAIKDIKTFIRACHIIKQSQPSAQFYIVGPIDQNHDYYLECVKLIEQLGLTDIQFTGEVDSAEYYRILDIVVLSSVSEGLPFALMEAMACGIPTVATDVGGCTELLSGFTDNFGDAGYLCPPKNPGAIAESVLKIYSDNQIRQRFSNAARKRIQRYFHSTKMIDSYRAIYQKYLSANTFKKTDSLVHLHDK